MVAFDQSLDDADWRILAVMQNDATLSTTQLAAAVNMSQSACWRRLQRLRDDGIIKAEVALVDRRKVGLNTQVFAQVKLTAHGRSHFEDFAVAIRAFPEVLDCFVLMGSVDFMLRIVTRDIESYEAFFFQRLSKVPGIQEISSMVALSEIKSTTALTNQSAT
jgi:Lrp/AsnC family transcriptional regulator